ncbi:MAG: S8 family serine peptidase [Anaerolineae bacterium]|nr:S8 family serine peptidase [Gloeobacterales cyanobacterium ES-bin-313]
MRQHSLSLGIRLSGFAATFLSLSLGMSLTASPVLARPGLPLNMDSNLSKLVEDFQNNGAQLNRVSPQEGASAVDLAAFDSRNRVRVDIYLNGSKSLAQMHNAMVALRDINIVAETDRYRSGVIEAYIPLSRAVLLARMPGVSSVILSSPPATDVGATTSQAVVQHKVDQVPANIDGTGITVGTLSDSYNTSTNPIKEANDIASGDLPGTGNPLGNTTPVVITEELGSAGIDEGRAMLQLIHDVAPKAKLCFATAFNGQVGFANNILRLADPSLTCKADVIVDDIIYFAEPFFSDGIVAQAVDDVANGISFPSKKVPYFSSAGNRPSTQAYLADARIIPVTGATTGTNISLTGIDPALYAGGFHNFRTDGGQDIAQNISISGNGTISFQWDDPYDVATPTLGATLLSSSGVTTTANPTVDFPLAGTAGQRISIFVDGNASNPPINPDVTITLLDPAGNQLAFADSGTNPETLLSFLPTTGNYTIRVGGFQGAVGSFTITVQEASGTAGITSDYNLLFFRTNGTFLASAAANNFSINQPIESLRINGTQTVQMVIARANTPAPIPTPASKLRYVWFTSGTPTEYFSYAYPVTFGHNSANGAFGTAAYSAFPPNIPESFSSPGQVTVYFDANNNRLATPEVRLKPDIAAMDGANTTFFSSDVSNDTDTFPNFFGTSAAAPHAAAITALVLQAAGGPGTLTPPQVRSILQRSAFPHDLDPYSARALASVGGTKVTVQILSDNSATSIAGDLNVFRVSVTGSGSPIQSITFDASGGNVTGGNVTVGSGGTPGLVYDFRPANGTVSLPFTLGTLRGISAANITATSADQAPAPAVTNQFKKLILTFTPGSLSGGKGFNFNIDRDEASSSTIPPGAVGGNSADQFGGGVLLPSGVVSSSGVTISGFLENGSPFSGIFVNRIGAGYSTLDGFGFIDATRAVTLATPAP